MSDIRYETPTGPVAHIRTFSREKGDPGDIVFGPMCRRAVDGDTYVATGSDGMAKVTCPACKEFFVINDAAAIAAGRTMTEDSREAFRKEMAYEYNALMSEWPDGDAWKKRPPRETT